MRIAGCVLIALLTLTAPPAAQKAEAPKATPVATMKELMVDLVYPTSDVIFYVGHGEALNDADWQRIKVNALMMAEAANLLMMPGRARDQGQWMKDAQLLLDVGRAAYRGAQKKDYDGLVALNDQLYESCQSCHVHYRPGYVRRP